MSEGVKGIVGAVVIFNHGPKFGIIFLVSYHPAHDKSIASKKVNYYRITRISDLLAKKIFIWNSRHRIVSNYKKINSQQKVTLNESISIL
jgi:hypothetical protein